MPLPVNKNIAIRNAVRKGLGREPIIRFIDDEYLARAPVGQLQRLIESGTISSGRAEEILASSAAFQPERVVIAKPTRAGDFVTGLSQTFHFEDRVSGDLAFFTSPSKPGPHILSDISVQYFPEADTEVSYDTPLFNLMVSDTDQGAGSSSAGLPLESIFQRNLEPGGSWPGQNGIAFSTGSRPLVWSSHIDKFINKPVVYYVFQSRTLSINTSSRVIVTCTIREVGAVERAALRPQAMTAESVVTRKVSTSTKVAASRTSGAPVREVVKSPSGNYMVFLSDREFEVPASRLSSIFSHYNPLAVVPSEEADDARGRVQHARLRRGIIGAY